MAFAGIDPYALLWGRDNAVKRGILNHKFKPLVWMAQR